MQKKWIWYSILLLVFLGALLLVYETTKEDQRAVKPTIQEETGIMEESNLMKTVKGILIVNKTYGLPQDYNPGTNPEASDAVNQLSAAALNDGHSITVLSGFRDYNYQVNLYKQYVEKFGEEEASKVSAKPGYSEHQTGLSFDVGKIDKDYGKTPAGIWLKENCQKFGFIIRYPEGKENITGYQYEPWHIRYVGVKAATAIMDQKITLEEYLELDK